VGFVVLADTGEEVRVGKIVAVGANYRDHVEEMGMSQPKEPVVFLKPSTSIIHEGDPIVHPGFGSVLHHEVELGLVISRRCTDLAAEDAPTCVLGYLLALDLTLRDLQSEAKKKGLPWSVSKGFDGACPISSALALDDLLDLGDVELGLKVNDETRQQASTAQMVWKPADLVAIASRYFTLERGDILLTGTPSGVGPLKRGDVVEAWLGDAVSMRFDVT
jgi:2-keto-4-pentenoate hydratase/2-oxohepta-3-ene-1,7-dioic acid hydratase in catechol pathway